MEAVRRAERVVGVAEPHAELAVGPQEIAVQEQEAQEQVLADLVPAGIAAGPEPIANGTKEGLVDVPEPDLSADIAP